MKPMSIASHLIPTEMSVTQNEEFLAECVKLRNELIAEFSSADLAHRMHGSHKTYLDGCQGPFCKQAHRTYYRTKREAEPSDYWRVYDPILSSMAKQIQSEIDAAVLRARNEAFKSLGKTNLLHNEVQDAVQ